MEDSRARLRLPAAAVKRGETKLPDFASWLIEQQDEPEADKWME